MHFCQKPLWPCLTPELSRTAARHGGVVHVTALSRAAKWSRLERIVRPLVSEPWLPSWRDPASTWDKDQTRGIYARDCKSSSHCWSWRVRSWRAPMTAIFKPRTSFGADGRDRTRNPPDDSVGIVVTIRLPIPSRRQFVCCGLTPELSRAAKRRRLE